MPTYSIHLKRTDIYTAVVEFDAASEEDARKEVNEILSNEGWNEVCNDEDGDYEECFSEVVKVVLVADNAE